MADVTIDTHELRAYTVHLQQATLGMARDIHQVVSKGARNIKEQLKSELEASTHFAKAAKAVSYDLVDGGFAAEIGATRGTPGSLAVVAYFAGSHPYRGGRQWSLVVGHGPGGGGTVADPRGALDKEAPAFERALLDVVERRLS